VFAGRLEWGPPAFGDHLPVAQQHDAMHSVDLLIEGIDKRKESR